MLECFIAVVVYIGNGAFLSCAGRILGNLLLISLLLVGGYGGNVLILALKPLCRYNIFL